MTKEMPSFELGPNSEGKKIDDAFVRDTITAPRKNRIPKKQSTNIENTSNEAILKERSDFYDMQGATVEFARELPEIIEEKFRENRYRALVGYEHFEAFYLSSSDPIDVLLKRLTVRGEHVLTVGGNSDFAKIFIANGAKTVDVFDISLPAIFYNELCIVALQTLDYQRFQQVINTWKYAQDLHNAKPIGEATIFDAEGFSELRPLLSPQACAYFEELMKHPDLFFREGKYFFDFAQTRRDSTLINNSITSETAYKRLQSKARKVQVSFSFASANAMAAHIARANGVADFPEIGRTERESLLPESAAQRFAGVDMVYISNIDYQPEQQINLAKSFLKAGVKRVIFTVCAEDGKLFFYKYVDAPTSPKIKGLKHPTAQATIDVEQRNKMSFGEKYILTYTYDKIPVFPGDIVEYKGAHLRIVDYSKDANYGIIVEMTKENFSEGKSSASLTTG